MRIAILDEVRDRGHSSRAATLQSHSRRIVTSMQKSMKARTLAGGRARRIEGEEREALAVPAREEVD
jgi:hypothetical protein